MRTLDSETLTARPSECMAALGELFGIELDAAAVVAGPAFQQHSKDRGAFGAADRAAERASGLASMRAKSRSCSNGAHAVADHAGVPMDFRPRSTLNASSRNATPLIAARRATPTAGRITP